MLKTLFSAVLVIFLVNLTPTQCKSARRKKAKSVSDVINDVCLPEGTDRLVYRYHNNSHVYVGFDPMERNRVYILSWEISKGDDGIIEPRPDMQYSIQPADEFRSSIDTSHILAATSQAVQKTFRRKMEPCQKIACKLDFLIQVLAECAMQMTEVTYKCAQT